MKAGSFQDDLWAFEEMARIDDRPPATGLNNNIEFMGKRLHIQTENISLPKLSIVTQVFSNGRIIYSKKTECSQALNEIQDQMHKQHFEVIQGIADKQARLQGAS
jgi:hypothetical protein